MKGIKDVQLYLNNVNNYHRNNINFKNNGISKSKENNDRVFEEISCDTPDNIIQASQNVKENARALQKNAEAELQEAKNTIKWIQERIKLGKERNFQPVKDIYGREADSFSDLLLERMKIRLYGKNNVPVYEAIFDTDSLEIIRIKELDPADKNKFNLISITGGDDEDSELKIEKGRKTYSNNSWHIDEGYCFDYDNGNLKSYFKNKTKYADSTIKTEESFEFNWRRTLASYCKNLKEMPFYKYIFDEMFNFNKKDGSLASYKVNI